MFPLRKHRHLGYKAWYHLVNYAEFCFSPSYSDTANFSFAAWPLYANPIQVDTLDAAEMGGRRQMRLPHLIIDHPGQVICLRYFLEILT